MRRWVWKRGLGAGGIVLVLGVAGALVAASGIVPIKASSGHWAVTEWLLQFAKRRSVATQALGIDLPKLDEPWLVLKGAGHYETGCRPCHGSPDLKRPRVPAGMTPRPPYLPPRIATWDPGELFYMVKHGIKFTGMPAWPSLRRDDEVRAMVAFLLELPKLDAGSYRRLVDGDAPASGAVVPLRDLPASSRIPPAIAACARCHGADGRGRGLAAYPKLAGQKDGYLFRALRAYARGRRHSGIMEPIAASLRPDEWREAAEYYSNLPDRRAAPSAAGLPTDRVARGEEIAARGIPSQGVPSCLDCHGPGPHRRNPAYPNLAGQFADYLALQLDLFRQGSRGGSAYAHIMRQIATRLNAEQMRDVVVYYESLAPEADPTR